VTCVFFYLLLWTAQTAAAAWAWAWGWAWAALTQQDKQKLVFLKLKEFFFKNKLCYLIFSCILVTLKFRPSRQVCQPGAEQADKFVGLVTSVDV
jgi:hypothetical protein